MKLKRNFVRCIADGIYKCYYKVQTYNCSFRKERLRMCKIFDPLNAANNFIERGDKENIPISPMKLQKLLYFLYRDYLCNTGNPLFSERFETWQYGPVLSCVYHAFKHYGARSISDYYVDSDGKAQKINDSVDNDFTRVLNGVWETYKQYTGIELSNLTHNPDTAWTKAWHSDEIFLSDDYILMEGESARGT